MRWGMPIPGLQIIILGIYLSCVPTLFGDDIGEAGSNAGKRIDRVLIVSALREAYGDHIRRVERREGDIVFIIGGREIYYREGRMLREEHIASYYEYESIFYIYRRGTLTRIPDPVAFPKNRSSDFLDALVGDTRGEIASSSKWVTFLGRKAFVHEICSESLERVDLEINRYAQSSEEVRSFISNIKVVFSMDPRSVKGTDNQSYHAYGLALDIVPKNYGNKQVYWRWSSIFDEDWGRIPIIKRWKPPSEVIAAFEKNGFIWGGKWYHFDTIHFEYRPELLVYSEELTQFFGIKGENEE
jgi:hypothetical protein